MTQNDTELSKEVIGAAMTVLNTLRPGLDEKLYERALVIEPSNRGISCEQQKEFAVSYQSQRTGSLIPNLIIESQVVVDTKVVSNFNDTHIAQMLGYLNITGLKLGLLLNFKHAKLGIKRISS